MLKAAVDTLKKQIAEEKEIVRDAKEKIQFDLSGVLSWQKKLVLAEQRIVELQAALTIVDEVSLQKGV